MEKTDTLTDEELLREEAMTDGKTNVLGFQFEPITALTVSWMQRNDIFNSEKDLIWRTAAFAYLHTQPRENIRAIVNSKEDFACAVDVWIENNLAHHLEIADLAEVMNKAFAKYTSSISEAVTSPSKGQKTGKRKGRIG